MPYNSKNIIANIKELNLPIGQYVAVGGSTLAARGIRETKDLDIIVLPELYEKLLASGWESDTEYQRKWNRTRLKKGDAEVYSDLFLETKNVFLDIAELISTAEMIQGVPFQKLDHLMMCKLDTAREKDL